MRNFTTDGGNVITSVKVNSYEVDLDRKTNGDNLFIYRWIKDNVDKDATNHTNVFSDTMYNVYFTYCDKKLGMTVERSTPSIFTLMAPEDMGIEDFYTFIRSKLDSSVLATNKKK